MQFKVNIPEEVQHQFQELEKCIKRKSNYYIVIREVAKKYDRYIIVCDENLAKRVGSGGRYASESFEIEVSSVEEITTTSHWVEEKCKNILLEFKLKYPDIAEHIYI